MRGRDHATPKAVHGQGEQQWTNIRRESAQTDIFMSARGLQGGREKRKNPLFDSRASRASEPNERTAASAFRSLFRRRDRTETN
jgi:hypothetical protein